MCQACWALAARRSGDAAASRFTAVAEWVAEPEEDERGEDTSAGPPTADKRDD